MKDILINGVKEAGKLLKEDFYKPKNVSTKGIADLVTTSDIKIENFLINYFSKYLPEYRFVGEETTLDVDISKKVIIVDPIDGTTNFVQRFPFVSVSVGVYENETPVAGVVFNPILDELFFAEYLKGAYLNGERISVSKKSDLKDSLIGTGFPYGFVQKNRDYILTMLNNVLSKTLGVRRAGAASIDLCYVACGIYDGYYEGGLKPWDVAAGILIVKEALGVVTDLKNSSYNFFEEYVVASNGLIHNQLIEALNG